MCSEYYKPYAKSLLTDLALYFNFGLIRLYSIHILFIESYVPLFLMVQPLLPIEIILISPHFQSM